MTKRRTEEERKEEDKSWKVAGEKVVVASSSLLNVQAKKVTTLASRCSRLPHKLISWLDFYLIVETRVERL